MSVPARTATGILLGAIPFPHTRRLLLGLPVLACLSGCWSTIIYHPTPISPEAFAPLETRGWQRESIVVDAETTLVGLVRPAKPGTPWILYFGGNATPIAGNQEILEIMAAEHPEWGLAVFSYRGYDLSTGEPDQEVLVADGVRIVHHLMDTHQVESFRMFVAGQSLGTGVASLVVANLQVESLRVAGLVLLAPYTSLARVINDKVPLIPVTWTVIDSYPTSDVIGCLDTRILIVHGAHDAVISVTHSRELAGLLGDRAQFAEVNRGHNDLWVRPSPVQPLVEAFVSAP